MISYKQIISLAELYLLAPVVLWVCGWFQPWIAYPLASALVAIVAWHILGGKTDEPEQGQTHAVSLVHLSLYVLVSAVCVFLIGFDGRIMQSYDLIVRNPLYDEVIRQEWPLIMPDGRYVVYALMYWLPAGLLSSWCPAMSAVFIQLWVLLGIVLICIVLHFHLGHKRTLLFWGVILFFSPLAGTVDDVLNTVFIKGAIMGVHFRMPSPLTQFFNTFHYFIPTCLFLAVTMTARCKLGRLVILSSCYAVLHPMVAATAIPFLLIKVYKEQCARGLGEGLRSIVKTPELYPGLALVSLALLFYSSVTGCWFAFTFYTPYAPELDAAGIAVCIASIILTAILPLAVYHVNHDFRLIVTACLCPLLILVWYGAHNGVNEWLYKFSVLYGFFVAFGIASAHRSTKLYVLLATVALASLIPFMREMKRKQLPNAASLMFAKQEKNIRHEWKGTMYHPESGMYYPLTADSLKLRFLFKP